MVLLESAFIADSKSVKIFLKSWKLSKIQVIKDSRVEQKSAIFNVFVFGLKNFSVLIFQILSLSILLIWLWRFQRYHFWPEKITPTIRNYALFMWDFTNKKIKKMEMCVFNALKTQKPGKWNHGMNPPLCGYNHAKNQIDLRTPALSATFKNVNLNCDFFHQKWRFSPCWILFFEVADRWQASRFVQFFHWVYPCRGDFI